MIRDLMYKQISLIFTLLLISILTANAQYYGVSDAPSGNWKAGLQGGYSQLQGDVASTGFGFHGGAFVQKTLGRAFDFRIQLKGGQTQGQSLEPSSGFLFNNAWNGWLDTTYYYDSTQSVYHNYQLQFFDLSFLFKINLNRLFSQGSESWDLYVLGGAGAQFYQTYVNVYNELGGELYDFSTISAGSEQTLTQLQEIMDDTYETPAHVDYVNSRRWRNFTINTVYTVGAGANFSVSEKISLGVEGVYTFAGDDLLDGQQWLENNDLSPDRDKILSGSFMIIFNY